MTTELPAPTSNPDGAPYWAAAAEGRLEVQRCGGCGKHQFPPSYLCRFCGAESLAWRAVSGRGRVHSFTIVHRAPTPAFRARVPYVVALIDLDEGLRMMANIIGDDAHACAIDDIVEVCFEERGDGVKVPQFRRVET